MAGDPTTLQKQSSKLLPGRSAWPWLGTIVCQEFPPQRVLFSRVPSCGGFDYGSGNVHSALKALEAAGAEVTLTNDATVAREAEGLVVPGWGPSPP